MMLVISHLCVEALFCPHTSSSNSSSSDLSPTMCLIAPWSRRPPCFLLITACMMPANEDQLEPNDGSTLAGREFTDKKHIASKDFKK